MNQNQEKQGERKAALWFVNNKIDELLFLNNFSRDNKFRVVNGVVYDQKEHRVEDETMKQMIIWDLTAHFSDNLSSRSSALLSLMRIMWHYDEGKVGDRYIHLANGTWDTYNDLFTEEKFFSTRRIQVDYDLDAPPPERFLEYVNQLLEPEDVLTLQEYMGYCLIPNTKAQKMLVISGKGGEGKSVLGQIMGAMWGEGLMYGSIQKISTNRFARADLVNRLVMVDDDMSMEALTQTHYLKTLITLNGKTDVERKGEQSIQAPLFARFIGFTNGALTALYDRSHGFYRRIILLRTKDRPADRVDYPYLAEAIIEEELPGILNWCLKGLDRLFANRFQITVSERAKRNMEEVIRQSDPIGDFLESQGYIVWDRDGSVSSSDLYELFRRFCEDNALTPITNGSFQRQIKDRLTAAGAVYVNREPGQKQKSVRGYLGLRSIRPCGW